MHLQVFLQRIVILFMLALGTAGAQQAAARAPNRQSTFHAKSTVVLAPALVTTRSGELVYSLTADDFLITDNRIEQKAVLDEAVDQQPLALVVAIQTGGVSERQLHAFHDLGTMLEALLGEVPHQVALVTFGSKPQLVSDFSPDLSRISDGIKHLAAEDGVAAILDTTAYSLKLLERQPKESRRAILLISDMRDGGSLIPLKEVISEIGESNAVIYTVAFSSIKARLKNGLTDPGQQNESIQLAHDLPPTSAYVNIGAALGMASNALRKNTARNLAQLTGGEYLSFDDKRGFENDLNAIANHIPNRYMLSFQPSLPQPGLHTIEVKVRAHPELIVSARTRYWATSEINNKPAQ